RFSEGIQKSAEALGSIESLNVGKLKEECVQHDVARAADNIAFFARQAEEWPEESFDGTGKFLGKSVKTKSLVKRFPIGVAGLIIPWNSPIMLGTWKVGPCLATGNTCVLKPPPWASLSCLQLGEIANESGIPEGVLNIVPGGVEAGDALVRHPMVNRISFTGNVPAGRAVAKANAETRLAPLSLELGGKSPVVVFADCDPDLTVKGVARGIFRSQGQSCVAGS
ncbi:MAG: aldehyde dehydrogenase family protein, partial [Deltaproteobacteria bacterium]|nr:aldehyde dehydrogenase family protein [Deltaproteobacteria bacterium]